MTEKAFSYCENIVRHHDRDRYLLALAARRGGAADLFPLFAFNYEIAKTREVVSEPQLGLIRLQWWREALDAHYEGKPVPHHEVMEALVPVIEKAGLPQAEFEALLEAREADLEGAPPATTADLLDYAVRTVAPLNRLALQILAEEEEKDVVEAVSAAYGLVGLLRAVPWHAAQGRIYLPAGLMEAHGLTIQDLQKPGLPAAVRHILEKVLAQVEEFLKVRPRSRYLKASRRLAQIYARRLRRYGGNLRDERLQAPPAGFLMGMLLRDYLRR